ncbi:MAG: bifunctional diaminohydroxyphosphoribosylaminopyrimidine deaminase/5-amino-6-(5-phosphoribosylamino)uracil reductase RibD [Bacteroidales bacterium]|jgi:diaminohydroxyphosphoribosylaminopyrimidine deaminase/5-amino-6-(5-phosphoribosylamino)uracil reductase|nr:bifunctional diaminohydroxyphosphoribosylaminopyrimidine deaminase/5-amino-6-(5-phosphoribosylamino)uracil reductase RibD [Bacteroidales bacterium]
MPENDDIKFMQRCLDLAQKAEGMTRPNPMVGSVIVHGGLIIGEGYHMNAGGPHAEVNAIKSVRDKSLLGSSALYVNLEPCSHFGKTPPCSDLIISSGIRKVIIGTKDTSEKISGQGIAMLKKAGLDVSTGVLEEKCRSINRRFFTFNEKKRPYIVLKWAQSADGFLDIERGKGIKQRPTWITGGAERVLVHKWRAAEQAILAGAGTIRADDPQLTVRDWTGENPLRLILSSSGRIEEESMLFKIDGTNIVFTHNDGTKVAGAVTVKMDYIRGSSLQVAEYLYSIGIQSLMVEGGAKVLDHFIKTDFWDEARIFYGEEDFKHGIRAPVADGRILSRKKFSHSSLEVILNEKG